MEEEKTLNQNMTHTHNWLVLTALVPIVGLVTGLVLLFKKPRGHLKLGLLTILFSIILGLVYGYTYHDLNSSKSPYVYHYNQLVETRITAGEPETTATLERPVEFKASQLTSDSGGIYSHQIQLKSKSADIGMLSVSDSPLLNPQFGSSLLKPLITAFNQGPSNKQYSNFAKPIQTYIRHQLSDWNAVTLAPARPLRTPSLTNNSWQFDFTGSPINQNQPRIKGEALYIIGKKAIYLIILDTAEVNWADNTQVLQKVVDSIRIDQ